MGEAEGAGHGLKTKRVAVHVQRREGKSIRALIGHPLGGRLDIVQHLKKGFRGGGGAPRQTLLSRIGSDILWL